MPLKFHTLIALDCVTSASERSVQQWAKNAIDHTDVTDGGLYSLRNYTSVSDDQLDYNDMLLLLHAVTLHEKTALLPGSTDDDETLLRIRKLKLKLTRLVSMEEEEVKED